MKDSGMKDSMKATEATYWIGGNDLDGVYFA